MNTLNSLHNNGRQVIAYIQHFILLKSFLRVDTMSVYGNTKSLALYCLKT